MGRGGGIIFLHEFPAGNPGPIPGAVTQDFSPGKISTSRMGSS